MGGDRGSGSSFLSRETLKSTPPAWAGTQGAGINSAIQQLKSTPPAWAGTVDAIIREYYGMLKSTPPAWAGTSET